MIISDMYSQATVNQIISGCHCNHTVTADKIILQALFILWIKSLFHENAHVLMVINHSLSKVAYAFKHSDDADTQSDTQNLKQLTDIDRVIQ